MEWPRSGTGMAGWCQRSFEVSDCRHGRGCLGLEGGFSWEGNRKKSRDEKGDWQAKQADILTGRPSPVLPQPVLACIGSRLLQTIKAKRVAPAGFFAGVNIQVFYELHQALASAIDLTLDLFHSRQYLIKGWCAVKDHPGHRFIVATQPVAHRLGRR